ncbi:MAG TPA: c-type cytochrome [Bryobacteraceae bacterium]|jgi:mono/diheme cytochrome c family protein|nr:c-type cytochrome [Bryobacteraceae bacterium]
MNFRALLVLTAAFALSAAQQTQNPPTTPPPQPPAGAANGPQPGPAVKAPGPGQRTGEAVHGQQPSPAGGMADFLAIGPPADPEAAARGQKLFVANCAFCHGTNANGGNGGPDLVRSLVVLHDKGTGAEIGPVVHNGRPGKGMPPFPSLTDAQIHDIAQFLKQRHQAASNRMAYQIQNIVTGDPKAGEAYFNAHCASCHSATGDLAHIATKISDPVQLQQRFLYPKEEHYPGMPGPPPDPRAERTVSVKLPDGQSYTGKLDHIDDFSVALTDASGQHHSWLLDQTPGIQVEVHDPLAAHAKLLTEYTNADMHNILAYLETLK